MIYTFIPAKFSPVALEKVELDFKAGIKTMYYQSGSPPHSHPCAPKITLKMMRTLVEAGTWLELRPTKV